MSMDYQYAIAQLNVSRARLAVAIDKWDNEILQHGPEGIVCKLLEEARGKYQKIESAIERLNQHDYDIIQENGICPYCKCPIEQCSSDHK